MNKKVKVLAAGVSVAGLLGVGAVGKTVADSF